MRDRTAARIQADLARRGVPEEFGRSVSGELEAVAEELTPDAYEAVLSGVAMAYGAQRRDPVAPGHGEIDEMQRLLQAFAEELGKLDEALEMLAAYLTRLRTRSAGAGSRTVH